LPHMRWHELRHTAATWWAERLPEAYKKRLLGHAPSNVSDRYTHLPFSKLKEAVESMPWLLGPGALEATAPERGAPSAAAAGPVADVGGGRSGRAGRGPHRLSAADA